MKYSIVVAVVFLLIAGISALFYINTLTFKIQKAIWGKHCTVSMAVIKDNKTWSFNNKKVPLMSVFKYFVAVKVLNKIKYIGLFQPSDNIKRSLDDKILIKPVMISKTTYSPMLKKYTPPFKISVQDLMKYMISESDNNATDILIQYIGGIEALHSYFFCVPGPCVDFEILADEKMMNLDIKNQYLNKATPLYVLKVMKNTRETGRLSIEHRNFLDKIMIETVTGEDKLKAGLPKDVVFGHKTGSSSRKPDGIKIADNDAGFVILPDGSAYYIAVFITESKMTDAENAALIAQISKIVYEYLNAKRRIIK